MPEFKSVSGGVGSFGECIMWVAYSKVKNKNGKIKIFGKLEGKW